MSVGRVYIYIYIYIYICYNICVETVVNLTPARSCQKLRFSVAGRTAGWPAGWPASWLASWAGRSAGRLARRSAGRLAGRPVAWLGGNPGGQPKNMSGGPVPPQGIFGRSPGTPKSEFLAGRPVPKNVRGVAIFLYFREAAWSCQKSPFRAAGRAVGWPAGWSAGRMAGRPAASRSAGRLAGRPAGLMAGRVVSGVATQPAESCLGRTGPISKSLQSEFLARCPVLRTLMARSHISLLF